MPRSAGGGRGANFGWPQFEGNTYRAAYGAPPPGNVRPVLETLPRRHRASARSPAATSCATPGFRRCWAATSTATTAPRRCARRGWRSRGPPTTARSASTSPGLSSFGEDAAGCVYVASLAGPVSRLVERTREVPCADREAPILLVTAARRQRALRGGAVAVRAACSERCTVERVGHDPDRPKALSPARSPPGRRRGRRGQAAAEADSPHARGGPQGAAPQAPRDRARSRSAPSTASNHRAKTPRATVRIRR